VDRVPNRGLRLLSPLGRLLPPTGIPAYTALDLHLSWHLRHDLELYLVGRNLFSPHHLEFTSSTFDIETTEVEQTVFGGVVWRF
jgi:hypothetical protein